MSNPKLPNPLRYGEYLDQIAWYFKTLEETRPHKKELPKKVLNIIETVEEIERLVLPTKGRLEMRERPTKDVSRKVLNLVELVEEVEDLMLPREGNWDRREIPKEIRDLLATRKRLRDFLVDIEVELHRAMGRPANDRLAFDKLLPEMKAMIKSLELIQRGLHTEGHPRIPFTQLNDHIGRICNEYGKKVNSNRRILQEISRRIDPTKSEPSNFQDFQDLPSKVTLLLENKDLKRHNLREDKAAITRQVDDEDGSEAGGKLKWYIARVDELEGTIEECRQQEGNSNPLTDEERNDILTKASEEAGQLRSTISAKEIEIEETKATVAGLRKVQASIEHDLGEEKKQHQITSEAQAEILEQKNNSVRALKRAEIANRNAISDLEGKHEEQIRQLTAEHEGELAKQKGIEQEQYNTEIIAQRREHSEEKQRMKGRHGREKQELQIIHGDELNRQREHAEALQAQLDEEVQQHNWSSSRAQQKVKQLDDEVKTQQQTAEALRSRLDEEVHQYNRSRSRAQKKDQEHEKQRITLENQLTTLETQLIGLENQRIALENQYNQNLTEQKQLHSIALERAKTEKIEQLDKLRGEHKDRMTESESAWKLKFQQLVLEHEAKETEWEEALDLEKIQNKAKVEELVAKHNLVVDLLETDLRVEKASTAKKVQGAVQKHKLAFKELEKEYRDLYSKHMKQDKYTGLSDTEIIYGVVSSKKGEASTIGFSSLVSKVTGFSEWEWREDREIWPKDTMTALVGTQQRHLKKLILGDAIWTTLFRLIFCSPFRVLGKEGERLEADWHQSFPPDDDEASNGYSWPKPTALSEHYRWESCEAAWNALTKKTSPYNSLMSSYAAHEGQIQDDFLKIVEAYVNLSQKREQALLEFLAEAIRMWIIFSMQRYRLRVILPGSNESNPEKKSKLAQEQNDLKFTVAPRLQRHGNVKGEGLQEVSVFAKCRGEVARIMEEG